MVLGGEWAWAIDFTGGEKVRVRGNANAPLTLVEFSDFTCGYCMKFFKETLPRIQAKYIDTGKIRYIYRDFPRGTEGAGMIGALASRCAGDQGRYWPMHDRLFSSGGRFDSGDVLSYAKSVGLEQAVFANCLRDGKYRSAILREKDEAQSMGFRGTPGFVLLRTSDSTGTGSEPPVMIPGAFPFDVFEEQIDQMLLALEPKRKG
jgi:protein-disulfide isomerase